MILLDPQKPSRLSWYAGMFMLLVPQLCAMENAPCLVLAFQIELLLSGCVLVGFYNSSIQVRVGGKRKIDERGRMRGASDGSNQAESSANREELGT